MSVIISNVLFLSKIKINCQVFNDAEVFAFMRSHDIKLGTVCVGSANKSKQLGLNENYFSVHKLPSVQKYASTQMSLITKELGIQA